MEIFLDGRPYPGEWRAAGPTVGEALIEIDQYLQANGRAMQSVELNGEKLAADELTVDMAGTRASQVERLSVTSARLSDLVLEAIGEVEAVLPELPIACQALATVFAGDDPGEGLGPLGDLLEIWEGLRESRERVAGALNITLAAIPFGGGTAEGHEEALEAMLGRVHDAVEKLDFKAAADLIAYDLNEFAEREPEIFKQLRSRCEGEATA
jgi:hypothetical protein